MLNLEELLTRYPHADTTPEDLELLSRELPLAQEMEPYFLQRLLAGVRAGKIYGKSYVSYDEEDLPYCGCGYGHGTGLAHKRAEALAAQIRETIRHGLITPLEQLVFERNVGETPQNNQSLALLEELILHLLVDRQEVAASPQSC